MGAAKLGGQEARAGEVSVKCTEKAGLADFGFLRQGENGDWWSRRRLPKKKLHFGGSRFDGWVYHNRKPGAKMEIPA
jgi:hypothetical protein